MWRQYIAMKAYLFMIARNLHNDWRRREAPRADFTAPVTPSASIGHHDRVTA
jgi:hypothetical protein